MKGTSIIDKAPSVRGNVPLVLLPGWECGQQTSAHLNQLRCWPAGFRLRPIYRAHVTAGATLASIPIAVPTFEELYSAPDSRIGREFAALSSKRRILESILAWNQVKDTWSSLASSSGMLGRLVRECKPSSPTPTLMKIEDSHIPNIAL